MSSGDLYGLPADVKERLCHVFSEWPQIESVVIYGSRAKGNYRPGSDIDLCIRSVSLSLAEMLTIESQIDDLLLPWKVDLCLYAHIDNPALREHIERIGVTFYHKSN